MKYKGKKSQANYKGVKARAGYKGANPTFPAKQS